MRGQSLRDALAWSVEKRLTVQDYQFFKASQDLEKREVQNARAKKRILVIDDEEVTLENIEELLNDKGYEVVTAKNGKLALEMLEQEIPDLIICDILMPGMDGYSFVKHIREDPRTSWISVMFLSAKGSSQDRVQGLGAGADFYMTKPFTIDELIAQLEAALKQAERLIQHQNK